MASVKIKLKLETRRAKGEDGFSTYVASSDDVKFEMMMKTMDNLMDRLTIENKPLNKEKNESHIRNPKFRRKNPPPPPQIKQRNIRNPRNPDDQQIRTPFPENYVADEDDAKFVEGHIHHFGDLDYKIYFTKEEVEPYQRGYLWAIGDLQRKIKLRNKDVTINEGRFNQRKSSNSQQNIAKKKEKQTSCHDMRKKSRRKFKARFPPSAVRHIYDSNRVRPDQWSRMEEKGGSRKHKNLFVKCRGIDLRFLPAHSLISEGWRFKPTMPYWPIII